jgi:hypothetical protein
MEAVSEEKLLVSESFSNRAAGAGADDSLRESSHTTHDTKSDVNITKKIKILIFMRR